ncbi:unnamed protein product [Phyllotreta striolata]|uniref:Adenosine deaminase n=1 Tax=Phyllotreta striolata TaxID=444603 RepID=A0A9N9THN4_PHYSR|nr:unnamed protein product [Phyllotreta striolata]
MEITVIKLILLLAYLLKHTSADYRTEKNRLIELDRERTIGSKLHLTEKENRANEIITSLKTSELQSGFEDPNKFPSSQHFFDIRKTIRTSRIFQIIQKLPKGSSLHIHSFALTSQEYLYNLTFRENLYASISSSGELSFRFFPSNTSTNWSSLSQLRRTNRSNFEEFLKSKLTLVREDPRKSYPTVEDAWSAFQGIFSTVDGLISFKPVFEDFFYQGLKELREDNVKYVEIRCTGLYAYDLKGKVYRDEEVIGIYAKVIKRFRRDYPDFVGAKFIYAPHRKFVRANIDEEIEVYRRIRKAYPELVVGFDLVGQEDKGYPLSDFVTHIEKIRDIGGNLYFHAGETDWFGFESDENLFDAVLLNATRIGHAFALPKHPGLVEEVKRRGIAVEVCPISNQVLELVGDFRNHPAAVMMADGVPVVVGSDDPSFWGAEGLSHDWYVVFMAMTSRRTGLRFLKQLALNSLSYSSLNGKEMGRALEQWKVDWDEFIEFVIKRY